MAERAETPSAGRGRGRGSRPDTPSGPRGRGRGITSPGFRAESSTPPLQNLTLEDRSSALKTAVRQSMAPPDGSMFLNRPGFGKSKERTIELWSNHFPMEFPKNAKIYQYDVEIVREERVRGPEEEDTPKLNPLKKDLAAERRERKVMSKTHRLIMQEVIRINSGPNQLFEGIIPVFDGQKNMYTIKPLALQKRERRVLYAEAEEDFAMTSFKVAIMPTTIIDLSNLANYFDGQLGEMPLDCVQAIDVVLRHGPTMNKVPIGASLYASVKSETSQRFHLGGGRELAYGFYQSARPTISRLHMIIDRTTTAFYMNRTVFEFIGRVLNMKTEVIDLEGAFLKRKGLEDRERGNVEREIKGLRVQVMHLSYKRSFKVIGLTEQPMKDVKFRLTKKFPDKEVDLGEKSVMDHFKEAYQKDLKFGQFPCLIVGSKNRPQYLPIEVCELVPDQHCTKTLTGEQTAQMIRQSASQSPTTRFEAVKNAAKQIASDSQHFTNEFEIQLSQQPIQVSGRILKAPQIIVGNAARVQAVNGQWDRAMRGNTFQTCGQLSKWTVICRTDEHKHYTEKALIPRLMNEANRLGMIVNQPLTVVKCSTTDRESICRCFDNSMKLAGGKIDLIVFIIPENETISYQEVKYVGDVMKNIPTQAVSSKNIRDPKPAFLFNLLLKINTKVLGTNGIVAPVPSISSQILKRAKTMIVGVDITHPSDKDQVKTSISAAVGTINAELSQFATAIHIAERADTMVREINSLLKELLDQYKEYNQCLPDQIIIYRDGVSEGQFIHLMNEEVDKLGIVFEKLNFKPKVTFVVVQKRHHTRVIPVNQREGVGRAANVPPGTVIDTTIVHPRDFDFYLISHEGIQGTSRPTHYTCLLDENGLSADDLQEITYLLSHNFNRCCRSISVPSVVAYAHLAAYRARIHYDTPNPPEVDRNIVTNIPFDYRRRVYYC